MRGVRFICGIVWVVCWAGLVGGACGQSVNLSQVESLQKPISLRLKMRPLRELVEQASQQTDITLGVAKAVEQYKITVFVTNRPASTVLNLVAQQLSLEWQQDSQGRYFLTEPTRVREARLKLARAAGQQYRSRAIEWLRRLQQQAQTDFTTLHARLKQLDAEQDRLQELQPSGWMDTMSQLAQARAQIADAAETLPRYLLGKLTTQWSQEQWARFWNGQAMLASTKPIPIALSLPADLVQWLALWSPNSFDRPPDSALVLARWDGERGNIHLFLIARAGEQSLIFTETISVGEASTRDPVRPASAEQATDVPETPIRRRPNEPPFQSPYVQPVATLADHLEWLAERCDVAIIADAFRLPLRTLEPHRNARTLREWVQNLTREEPVEATYQDGLLLLRHRERDPLLTSEIDEPILETIEQRAQSDGLSLDDYAALAYQLTREQQQRLETPNGYALRFDPAPFHNSIPALRFWASLTATQKQTARERQPIAYPTLSAVQQRLFWDAIEHALTTPTLPTGDLLTTLDQLYDPESQANLAFYLDFWKNFSFEVSTEQVKLVFEDVEDYQKTLQEFAASGVPVAVQERERHSYSLYFGFETNRAARYPIAWQSTRSRVPKSASTDR
jgi:hypothetical protein